MKLLDFPVRNYQFTVVLFAMLAALGLASWSSIPKGEDPPLDFPTFTIVAAYPGASSTDLERLVVRDVEKKLDALENVKKVESQICSPLYDDERIACQRLDSENIDKVEWQSFAFGSHHPFLYRLHGAPFNSTMFPSGSCK